MPTIIWIIITFLMVLILMFLTGLLHLILLPFFRLYNFIKRKHKPNRREKLQHPILFIEEKEPQPYEDSELSELYGYESSAEMDLEDIEDG
jgi:hypothetical protein